MNDIPEVVEHLRHLAQEYHALHVSMQTKYQKMTSLDSFLTELKHREAILLDRFRRVQHQLLASLKQGELSIIYPIMALTFIWVTLFSAFLLLEPVSISRWIGVGMIFVGVAVLGVSSR